MMRAHYNGQMIEARPKLRGTCPACGAVVIARCGARVVWHWAHEGDRDCDAWAEHETQWHRDWKLAVPPDRREVVRGPHRADMLDAFGRVVEIQHSPIPIDEIDARERHYGKMWWIFDARAPAQQRRLIVDACLACMGLGRRSSRYHTEVCSSCGGPGTRKPRDTNAFVCVWKRARLDWLAASGPVLLDLGTCVLRVRYIGDEREGGVVFLATALLPADLRAWIGSGTPMREYTPRDRAIALGMAVPPAPTLFDAAPGVPLPDLTRVLGSDALTGAFLAYQRRCISLERQTPSELEWVAAGMPKPDELGADPYDPPMSDAERAAGRAALLALAETLRADKDKR